MGFDVNRRLVEFAAGVYVEEDVLRVVDAVRAYDPNLVVKYLDPDRGGELDDPPYKIFERCPDGHERLVFGVWTLDNRVMERLYAADTRRFDIAGQIERNNTHVKEEQKRRFREEVLAEARDQTEHVIKSPKGSYTLPGPEAGLQIVVDSHHPTKMRTTKTHLEVVPDAAL